ncbi:DUF4291 domain-containing protein [Nocardioides sp. NBC_00163]|uniref:DUF4291 domain-containing protein n=1 Tax=Nocardioides sp. NBC_00163 TaxID=2975999 RepID=UPI003252CA2B
MSIPKHQIRATYDAETITVYQTYSPAIANPAVAAGTFVPPFSLTRMTWIKPSFLWMMYRCGWATKPGQERVLAVRITRAGFESALSQACLSHFDRGHHADRGAWRDALRRSPVRIQWDPERTPSGTSLPHRSLQIGLGPEVVPAYVDDWIVGIDDITDRLPAIRSGEQPRPTEMPYPLPTDVAARIGASSRASQIQANRTTVGLINVTAEYR